MDKNGWEGEVTCHNVLYIYIQRVYPEKVMNFQMRKPVKRCAHVEAVSTHRHTGEAQSKHTETVFLTRFAFDRERSEAGPAMAEEEIVGECGACAKPAHLRSQQG